MVGVYPSKKTPFAGFAPKMGEGLAFSRGGPIPQTLPYFVWILLFTDCTIHLIVRSNLLGWEGEERGVHMPTVCPMLATCSSLYE